MIRVFLVDDHSVLREGLVQVLLADDDIVVVGHADSGPAALEALAHEPVDVLVTDQSMPGMDGRELVERTRALHPGVRIVVLTMHEEVYLFREMERAGAAGFILKKDPGAELAQAIRAVHSGGTYVSSAIRTAVAQQATDIDPPSLLSKRETEILQLVVQELSNVEIAERLFISVYTVETHRKNIFRKTGASSLVGLINFAHDNGLVEP